MHGAQVFKGEFSLLLRAARLSVGPVGITQAELGRRLLRSHNRKLGFETRRMEIRYYEAGIRLPNEERTVRLAELLEKNPQVFLDAMRNQRAEAMRRGYREMEARNGEAG